ncbi:IS5 family transposase [Brucella intermedia]|uniref:IS5 family transposase n=2 Tax=Brucella intermedia TaxID=94625 RepID=UPI001FFE9FC3|nr:IS5 family transposase [Brucella intermedia]
MEPSWRVRPHLRGAGRRRSQSRAHHDRRHTSESASHGREPAKKGDVSRRIGRTKGGLNSKLHTVCDGEGRPIIMLLSEGQMSDHKGARLVLNVLPTAKTLIADRGYDSKSFREALQAKGIEPCIPSSRSRKVPYSYDKVLYKKRHKVENLFAKLKDWRRIATRYDRCAHTFFSVICIAAAVIFWL